MTCAAKICVPIHKVRKTLIQCKVEEVTTQFATVSALNFSTFKS